MSRARLRVVIIGLGAMGSAAAYHLASRGATVTGLETFGPAHDRGSSHGESRIIRQAYFEDPGYVPLVLRAYQLWQELEDRSPGRLLERTGGVMIGPPDGELVQGSISSARRWGIPHRLLSATELGDAFPALHPGPGQVGVVEPEAGVLAPELAILAHLRQAEALGAQLHFGEPALDWAASEAEVVVRTASGTYAADRLIVTAGPWSGQLLGDSLLPLQVERQVMVWFAPGDIRAFTAPRCPVYLLELSDGSQYYGLPTRDGRTAKAARHHGGEATTANGLRREISRADVDAVREGLAETVPDLAQAPVTRSAACLYTNTPDLNFVIGTHPALPRVGIAAGFSGHGFKFSPVVGEILADLAQTGATAHEIVAFAPGRFPDHQSGGKGISGSAGTPTPISDITSPIR